MKNEAYFIAPYGEIIPIGLGKHIDIIFENPNIFGYSKDYVKQLYKKYNEPLGFDGKAKKEIVRELLRKGWVRIRYVVNKDRFTVEYSRLTKRKADYIWDWANKITNGELDNVSKYTGIVLIDESTSSILINCIIEDILHGKYIFESKRKIKYKTTVTKLYEGKIIK